jgi:multidrug transporter EmrE-like cation transporter
MTEILNNLNPNRRFWIVIKFAILISIIESLTQLNIKKKNLVYGIIGYSIIVFILYKAYDYEGLGHMNLVWSCVSIISCYIIGYIFFNEQINHYTLAAILFATTAIYLAHRSDEVN